MEFIKQLVNRTRVARSSIIIYLYDPNDDDTIHQDAKSLEVSNL